MSVFGGPNVTDSGLVLNLDAGNIKSYPGTGTIWFDKSGNANNGTLINGPTFNTGSLGSIVFDGVDDYVSTNYSGGIFTTLTLSAWIYKTNTTRAYILNSANPYGFGFEFYETTMYFNVHMYFNVLMCICATMMCHLILKFVYYYCLCVFVYLHVYPIRTFILTLYIHVYC
jgi:hypothetical protein